MFWCPFCINLKWWSDFPWSFAKTCWDTDLEVQNKLQIVTLEVLLSAIVEFEHSCKEITMGVSKIMLFTIAILLYLFGCFHGGDSEIFALVQKIVSVSRYCNLPYVLCCFCILHVSTIDLHLIVLWYDCVLTKFANLSFSQFHRLKL